MRRSSCFNSRAREGRDHEKFAVLVANGKFQFTRPRGARLGQCFSDRALGRFNSRAREGRDKKDAPDGKEDSRFNSRAREGRDRR